MSAGLKKVKPSDAFVLKSNMTEKPNLRDRLVSFAESSSLHGVPKIVSSKRLVVMGLWCLLLIGAVGICTFQVYQHFTEYYAFPTQTMVTLTDSQLQFPSITICNMNPVRYSKISVDSELNNLLYGQQPSQTQTNSTNNGFDTVFDLLYDDVLDANATSNGTTTSEEDNVDAYYIWNSQVLARIAELPEATRKDIGHNITVMLHSAKFAGYNLYDDDFNHTLSPEYGNCYTLNTASLAVTGTGSRNGLRLVLNLETEEYLNHFSSGSGIRLVIHEINTLPHPEEDGITLSPGYETNIAMKMTKLQRLGAPYGDCSDDFLENYILTNQDCHKSCTAAHTIYSCGCVPYFTPIGSTVCKSADDIACVRDYGAPDCDCISRCNEQQYTMILSGRQWPNANYLQNVVLAESCGHNITSMDVMCSRVKDVKQITDLDYGYFAGNFLAANIYFDQLNHQVIEEVPQYTAVNLLSNIGGTMGFYMGASVLTYVELFQFILELILYCNHMRIRKKTVPKSINKI